MVQIIENFVESVYVQLMYEKISGNDFLWSYYEYVIANDLTQKQRLLNNDLFGVELPSFRHTILWNETSSESFNFFEPFIRAIRKKFGDVVFSSMHINLMMANERYTETALPHIDTVYTQEQHDQLDTYTGVFYLNTCQGDTVLYNELVETITEPVTATEYMRVSPEAGKFVVWDSRRLHSSPVAANQSRFLINVNFYVKK